MKKLFKKLCKGTKWIGLAKDGYLVFDARMVVRTDLLDAAKIDYQSMITKSDIAGFMEIWNSYFEEKDPERYLYYNVNVYDVGSYGEEKLFGYFETPVYEVKVNEKTLYLNKLHIDFMEKLLKKKNVSRKVYYFDYAYRTQYTDEIVKDYFYVLVYEDVNGDILGATTGFKK